MLSIIVELFDLTASTTYRLLFAINTLGMVFGLSHPRVGFLVAYRRVRYRDPLISKSLSDVSTWSAVCVFPS